MTEINEQPKTREELYERIKLSSKEQYIYDDMVRLGFWDKTMPEPFDPPQEVKERTALETELRNFKSKLKILKDEKAVLKQLRKDKMLASRKKQQENKIKREEDKLKKIDIWKDKQDKEIVYLGSEYSKGLNYHDTNIQRLDNNNLPHFNTPLELAQAMGIELNKLRFLAYSRKVSTYSHYIRFNLVKKSGGLRLISAPRKNLKEVQHWILNNILNKVDTHENVHGFKIARSIVTNAQNHLNSDAIINIDLENFFPTITYKRVKGLFINLGYSESVSIILALLCTEPEIKEVELDNKNWFIGTGQRFLPQGTPTSPAITNIICRKLDKRIKYLSDKLGFIYTRYADDITFSTKGESIKNIGKVLKYSESIITDEGFKINQNKTKILRRNTKQEVTGIVVNEKMNVDRKTLKKFRAVLYQITNEGFTDKNWNDSKHTLSAITGYANFVYSVNPVKGKEFLEKIEIIRKKYPNQSKSEYVKPITKIEKSSSEIIETNDETISEPVKNKWWKLF